MRKSEKKWSREVILEMIQTNDYMLCRGIIAIWNKQTKDEQRIQDTRHYNGVGFNGVDAKFLSSIASQLERGKKLSSKQIYCSRKRMLKYAGQLTRIANKEI